MLTLPKGHGAAHSLTRLGHCQMLSQNLFGVLGSYYVILLPDKSIENKIHRTVLASAVDRSLTCVQTSLSVLIDLQVFDIQQ